MSQQLYTVVGEAQSGASVVVYVQPLPFAEAAEEVAMLNGVTFRAIPAGSLTEWFCREGWKRYRR